MPVAPALGIARDILGPLGKEHVLLQRPPCPGNPVLEVADDVIEVDQPLRDQRAQRELHGRRVAARPRDQPRPADLLAIELGQAIDRLGLQFGRGMGRAIPFFVFRRIAQPEIRAEVHHLHPVWQVAHQSLRQPVRQRDKDKLDLPEINLADGDQPRQLQVPQMRKDLRHLLPRLAVGGQRGDPQLRMRRDDPHQLCPGIARRPQNRHVTGHSHLRCKRRSCRAGFTPPQPPPTIRRAGAASRAPAGQRRRGAARPPATEGVPQMSPPARDTPDTASPPCCR